MSETTFHPNNETGSKLSFEDFKKIIIQDYRIAVESRYVALLGRKEVLTGKAKFGIFGDGKELAQIALAKVFKEGDWRSGYYRDQTLAFASGITDIYHFFSQLYAHPDVDADPASAGRQMNCHFATRLIDEQGRWKNQVEQRNSAADISTTGGQMARTVGLGLASKMYRNNPNLSYLSYFSNQGNEVIYCTIGNAATSEGVFFEAVNAIGVNQLPVVLSIWDDGYGISVPNEIQTTKGDISEVLRGFQRNEHGEGFEIFKVKGWDYPGLCATYEQADRLAREQHIPCLIHVIEMTQPQGHSSSGSHERYKSPERLQWEKDFDCIQVMHDWIVNQGIESAEQLALLEEEAKEFVRQEQRRAWADYHKLLHIDLSEAIAKLSAIQDDSIELPIKTLQSITDPSLKEIYGLVRRVIRELKGKDIAGKSDLIAWYRQKQAINEDRYNSKLFTQSVDAPEHIPVIAATYDMDQRAVDGSA